MGFKQKIFDSWEPIQEESEPQMIEEFPEEELNDLETSFEISEEPEDFTLRVCAPKRESIRMPRENFWEACLGCAKFEIRKNDPKS